MSALVCVGGPAPKKQLSWDQGSLPFRMCERKVSVLVRDPRCRDQIMADTLAERLTGQAHAADVNVGVQIVMGLDGLLAAGASGL